MMRPMKARLFPWLTLLAGLVGFALQCWLFALTDPQGLLPEIHFAGIMSFLLLAAVLTVCFLAARRSSHRPDYRELFPASPITAAGILVGGIGLSISAFTVATTGLLMKLLVPVLGVFSGVCFCVSAYCRMKGLRPNCLLYCVISVYLLFRVLACCQKWGAEPQVQLYFFPLLACLFLLMASYYRAELCVQTKKHRHYLFFSQAALFCCCLSLAGSDWLFYLSAGIWLTADTSGFSHYHGHYA